MLSNTSQMTFFFQKNSAQVHCVCNTIQLSEIWFPCFRVFPGSAEAQVIWGGIVKRLLIAYFIGNIPAKKIFKKSIHVCQSCSRFGFPYMPFLAFSSPAVWCRVFQFRVFQSCVFQSCSFDCAMFSGLAFSVPPYICLTVRRRISKATCLNFTIFSVVLKPNSITLASSALAPNQLVQWNLAFRLPVVVASYCSSALTTM